jgi:hypothetical protein
MRENVYQGKLIRTLNALWPDAVVIRNDPSWIQGIPDILILFRHRWAALEIKTSADAREQPNQGYWVDRLNDMSFSAFIYPANEEAILYQLRIFFTM